jgi:regulator of sigma E protease
MAALISISIGFLNLMPVPLLDGGHLAYYAFEAIRRRPLSDRVQEMGFRVGLVVILLLVVVALRNDLMRLFS